MDLASMSLTTLIRLNLSTVLGLETVPGLIFWPSFRSNLFDTDDRSACGVDLGQIYIYGPISDKLLVRIDPARGRPTLVDLSSKYNSTQRSNQHSFNSLVGHSNDNIKYKRC